jgi:DnaJ-class molecular chaperone
MRGYKMAQITRKEALNKCNTCNGKGYKNWFECEDNAGHDNRDLVVDDTRYYCSACNGTGKENIPNEMLIENKEK